MPDTSGGADASVAADDNNEEETAVPDADAIDNNKHEMIAEAKAQETDDEPAMARRLQFKDVVVVSVLPDAADVVYSSRESQGWWDHLIDMVEGSDTPMERTKRRFMNRAIHPWMEEGVN